MTGRNGPKSSSSNASSTKDSDGPSSPAPSISCVTCAQLSQLEIEAFAAVREVAPYVRSISVSEILTRTPELLFLNLVTLENEPFCIELTQKGWRICSDRLDCMYGDFRKLEMHVQYYDTIYALLDTLSKLYRDQFGAALARRLDELHNQQQNGGLTVSSTVTAPTGNATTEESQSPTAMALNRERSETSVSMGPNRCDGILAEHCVIATVVQQHRRQPCAECPAVAARTPPPPSPPPPDS